MSSGFERSLRKCGEFFPSRPVNTPAYLSDGEPWEWAMVDLLIAWRLAVPLVSLEEILAA